MLDYTYKESDEWKFADTNALSLDDAHFCISRDSSDDNIKDVLGRYALHILLQGYPEEAYEWTKEMREMHDKMLRRIVVDNHS